MKSNDKNSARIGELAVILAQASEAKKKAAAAEESAKAELVKLMGKRTETTGLAVVDKVKYRYSVSISKSEIRELDLTKFRRLITPEQFYSVATVTQKAAATVASKSVIDQCLVIAGERVTVKATIE